MTDAQFGAMWFLLLSISLSNFMILILMFGRKK